MQSIVIENHELPYEIDEEIKTLRTNLQFSGADKKVIMITSCVGDEGKSTQSLRLSRSLAALGKTVLLIDADLRKSHLKNQIIEGTVDAGLSHYLSGLSSDIIYSTNIPCMYMIFAGQVPPNPSELLSGQKFSELIQDARDRFDYIIIDTPPLGMVVDAAVIAPHCDGAILAIQAGEIPRRMAQDVVEKLKTTQVAILGVVLTQIGKNDSKHTYSRYYGRKYGKYSRYSKKYYKYEQDK